MRSGNSTISSENIELEIYKTFEEFKEKKHIKITEFLKAFDVTLFQAHSYRKIKYSYESLIRLVIFQKLKGITCYTKVTNYLKRNPFDRFKLGFTQTPNRALIGYFINHILDKDTKELLDFAVSKIKAISEKFGIILDVNTFKPEKAIKETKERNRYLQKNNKTKEICRLFKRRVAPFINFNLNANTTYKKNQFINLLIHMGMTRDFAENGSKTNKELRGLDNPSADTLLYHLKQYKNYKDIHRMFTTLFEIIWEMTRTANFFDKRKSYDVAVDYTEWYYYGNRSTPMVVGKKPERGTSKCFRFATINIVEPGKRFTILALPVGPFDDKNKILEQLLRYTLERIRINRIYVDRGFFDSASIKLFHRFHVTYLMPCTHISTVKHLIDISPAPVVITDFIMADTKFNLVILQEKNEYGQILKYAFATNEMYDEKDVNLTERLFFLYSKRWGIESSYRVKKQSFLAKTTSKNYFIRLFYFMFSVLLYNLWILADILVWFALFGTVKDNHLLTSKYFGTLLYTIDPGGG